MPFGLTFYLFSGSRALVWTAFAHVVALVWFYLANVVF